MSKHHCFYPHNWAFINMTRSCWILSSVFNCIFGKKKSWNGTVLHTIHMHTMDAIQLKWFRMLFLTLNIFLYSAVHACLSGLLFFSSTIAGPSEIFFFFWPTLLQREFYQSHVFVEFEREWDFLKHTNRNSSTSFQLISDWIVDWTIRKHRYEEGEQETRTYFTLLVGFTEIIIAVNILFAIF